MIKYLVEKESIINICNAIRDRLNSTEEITFSNIVPSIYNIQGGSGSGADLDSCFIPPFPNIDGTEPYLYEFINHEQVETLDTAIKENNAIISYPGLSGSDVYGYLDTSNSIMYIELPPNNANLYIRKVTEKTNLNAARSGNSYFQGFNNAPDSLFYFAEEMNSYAQYCYNYSAQPLCGERTKNFAEAYLEAKNMVGYPICGNNVVNMARTYDNCQNLTSSPVCGPNVLDMHYTYNNCRNLVGAPVCGPNVISMNSTYNNCIGLTGSPVCGDNVLYFDRTYNNCISLTGSPVCGQNVLDFDGAYINCYNLTGAPVCADSVVSMFCTYELCGGLTGSPVCGPNVVNFQSTYANCSRLTGSPIFGESVEYADSAYYSCQGLDQPIQSTAKNLHNLQKTFYGCYNLIGDLNNLREADVLSMNNTFRGCSKLDGEPLCFPNLVNWDCDSYTGCYNLGGNLYMNTICPPSYSSHNNLILINIYDRLSRGTYKQLNMYFYNTMPITELYRPLLDTYSYSVYKDGSYQTFKWNKVNDSYYTLDDANLTCSFVPEPHGLNFNQQIFKIFPASKIDYNTMTYYVGATNFSAATSTDDIYFTSLYDGIAFNYQIQAHKTLLNKQINSIYSDYEILPASQFFNNSLTNLFSNCNRLNVSSTDGWRINIEANGLPTNNMFRQCDNLQTNIPIVYNSRSMINMFYNCYKLTGSPAPASDTFTTDMTNAYFNCTNITGDAYIGNYVKNANYAFYNCVKLDGVGTLGNTCFNATMAFICTNITSLDIYAAKSNSTFRWYNKLCKSAKNLTTVDIKTTPAFFPSLEEAFMDCSKLETFKSNAELMYVRYGNSLFKNCSNLQGNITLAFGGLAPEKTTAAILKTWGLNEAFRNANKLSDIFIKCQYGSSITSTAFRQVCYNTFNRGSYNATRLNVFFNTADMLNEAITASTSGRGTFGPYTMIEDTSVIGESITMNDTDYSIKKCYKNTIGNIYAYYI